MKIRKILTLGALLLAGTAFAQAIDHGTFTGAKRSLNDKPWGYTIVANTDAGSTVKNIERFEVRAGDCGSDPGWSDCANDRERSEITFAPDNSVGSEMWYGLNILVPKDYINVYPTKVDFFQFYQPDPNGPVWMFQNYGGGLYIDRQVNHKDTIIQPLMTAAELNGKWHNVILHVKWSNGKDGLFEVYIDNVPKYAYTGPTLEGKTVYFKYGIYRTYLTRYEAKFNVKALPTQVLYFNNVRRANTRTGLK